MPPPISLLRYGKQINGSDYQTTVEQQTNTFTLTPISNFLIEEMFGNVVGDVIASQSVTLFQAGPAPDRIFRVA